MTVNEYRAKHPKCEYCEHFNRNIDTCVAKEIRHPTKAKRCELFSPRHYEEKPNPFKFPEPGTDNKPLY